MELVPEIKEAKRLTVWDQDTKSRVQTRSMKIHWEGSKLPEYIYLGILTMLFSIPSPSQVLQVPEI